MSDSPTMDPTPPRKPKERPFYEVPEKLPTSSKIINEARSSLRTLRTTRPFTPRDEKRSLFGSTTTRTPENRPPSAFSLGSKNFDGNESRPVSGTRLSPLDHTPKTPTAAELESLLRPPRPPTDPNRQQTRRSKSRQSLQHANSVDGGVSSTDSSVRNRSGSLTEVTGFDESVESNSEEQSRRVHSGPKERTPALFDEERGIADGQEMSAVFSSTSMRSPTNSAGSEGRTHHTFQISPGAQRTGSAGKKDERDDTIDIIYYNDHISPLVEELASFGKKKDADKICELTDNLYGLLDKENLLGKNCKQRSSILKTIFKLLDVEEPKVLLRLARLILAFRVTGNNLLNVCKLVFKVSRNEKNDQEFLEVNIIDLILETIKSTDHVSCCDALIYCVGAIKFLTGNSMIVKKLVKRNCIDMLGQLIININKTADLVNLLGKGLTDSKDQSHQSQELQNRQNGKANDQLGHILVQLTAALRNLSDVSGSREKLVSANLIENLNQIVETYPSDSDLMLNISRIFSKVTLHTDCCQMLAEQQTCYKSFLHLLSLHCQKDDLIVRVCFILGNLTAKNDVARQKLFNETCSIQILLSVLNAYIEMDIKNKTSKGKRDSEKTKENANKYEDVLIKVIRVIANLAINEDIGSSLAGNEQCVQSLLRLLDIKDIEKSEELVLNTVATLNNVSFYSTKSSAVSTHQIALADTLLKFVLPDNMDAMLETARVFGNLTRQKAVREFLAKNKVEEVMITLLDSGNREVVYIACGVLVNFMADEDKRSLLKREGGIKKLLEVLRDFGKNDWQLASVVCQLLWNYSAKITSCNSCFGEKEAQDLNDVLVEYLDPEAALDSAMNEEDDEDIREYLQDCWEAEFQPVASQLLQRIEDHQSKFESLEGPS